MSDTYDFIRCVVPNTLHPDPRPMFVFKTGANRGFLVYDVLLSREAGTLTLDELRDIAKSSAEDIFSSIRVEVQCG